MFWKWFAPLMVTLKPLEDVWCQTLPVLAVMQTSPMLCSLLYKSVSRGVVGGIDSATCGAAPCAMALKVAWRE